MNADKHGAKSASSAKSADFHLWWCVPLMKSPFSATVELRGKFSWQFPVAVVLIL